MRKFLSIALSSAALLAFGVTSFAQQEYAYPHSIDLQSNMTASLFTVDGKAGIDNGVAFGGGFSMRFTTYPTDHLGMYAGLSFVGASADDVRYFAAVNRADANKYLYKVDKYDHYPYRSNYAPLFTAGLAGRFDFGQWSLRPRAGIGVTGFKMHDLSYFRISDNYRERVDIIQDCVSRDYLADPTYESRQKGFVTEASLQLTYTFYQHFYISAEAGLNIVSGRFGMTRNEYAESKDPNRPGQLTYDLIANYHRNASIPDLASLKVGIGWNLGWNRNARRGLRPVRFR